MSVYKQTNSKNWLVEFVIDGRRYRRSSGTNIKRKAETLEQKWRQEIHEGRFQIQTARALTLEDAASRYWKYVIVPKPSRERSKKAETYVIKVIVKAFGAGGQAGRVATSLPWQDEQRNRAPASGTGNVGPRRAIRVSVASSALWPQRLHQQNTATPWPARSARVAAPRRRSRSANSLRLKPAMIPATARCLFLEGT